MTKWMALFILIPLSMIVSRALGDEYYKGKEYMCPTQIFEAGKYDVKTESELAKRMKELHLFIPLGIKIGCEEKGWIAWKFIEYHMKKFDELDKDGTPIAYVLQYISKEDFDKWEKGQLVFNLELKAELVFCHKHKRASHFRYFIDGVERVIALHEKNGEA